MKFDVININSSRALNHKNSLKGGSLKQIEKKKVNLLKMRKIMNDTKRSFSKKSDYSESRVINQTNQRYSHSEFRLSFSKIIRQDPFQAYRYCQRQIDQNDLHVSSRDFSLYDRKKQTPNEKIYYYSKNLDKKKVQYLNQFLKKEKQMQQKEEFNQIKKEVQMKNKNLFWRKMKKSLKNDKSYLDLTSDNSFNTSPNLNLFLQKKQKDKRLYNKSQIQMDMLRAKTKSALLSK